MAGRAAVGLGEAVADAHIVGRLTHFPFQTHHVGGIGVLAAEYRGVAARWRVETPEEQRIFANLQAPVDGKYWCIGDQISHHTAWMESAMQSAHIALAELDRRVRAEVANA